MNTADAPTQAIPTVYNGVQLRSRMEAQCALLFDTLGWKWEYEPESFMLSNGTCYRPDFYIKSLSLVVECRGYSNDKGDRQISGFRDSLLAGTLPLGKLPQVHEFAVIGPSEASVSQVCGVHIGPFRVGFCIYCGWGSVVDGICDCGTTCYVNMSITCDRGKIFVLGYGSEEWANLFDPKYTNQVILRVATEKIDEASRAIDFVNKRLRVEFVK